MIDVLFEQRIIQNTGLGAEAIWQAVHETYECKRREEGMPFALVFLVLPLTFHQRTARALATRTQPAALYKALAEDREIRVGLQSRMQALAPRTFKALSIGFQTGLLRLDRNSDLQLIPARKTAPVTHVTEEVKTILKASKRVGQAIGEASLTQLTAHLDIQF
jgi:hypothetical protein